MAAVRSTPEAGPGALRQLLDEVIRTRATHAERRRNGVPWMTELDARRDSMRALEAYVSALEQQSWPVPRQIRDELRLHQTLCGHLEHRPGR